MVLAASVAFTYTILTNYEQIETSSLTLSASAGVQFILEPNVEFADAQHGSGESLLTDFSRERYAFPRWAPDGKKIAVMGYVSQANPNMAVVTVATRKVQMVQLPGHLSVSAAAWEPDSQSLIYMQPETAGADSISTTVGIFCQAPGRAARKTAWSPAFGIVLDLLPPKPRCC
jgi:Tol biopolymer transport system component